MEMMGPGHGGHYSETGGLGARFGMDRQTATTHKPAELAPVMEPSIHPEPVVDAKFIALVPLLRELVPASPRPEDRRLLNDFLNEVTDYSDLQDVLGHLLDVQENVFPPERKALNMAPVLSGKWSMTTARDIQDLVVTGFKGKLTPVALISGARALQDIQPEHRQPVVAAFLSAYPKGMPINASLGDCFEKLADLIPKHHLSIWARLRGTTAQEDQQELLRDDAPGVRELETLADLARQLRTSRSTMWDFCDWLSVAAVVHQPPCHFDPYARDTQDVELLLEDPIKGLPPSWNGGETPKDKIFRILWMKVSHQQLDFWDKLSLVLDKFQPTSVALATDQLRSLVIELEPVDMVSLDRLIVAYSDVFAKDAPPVMTLDLFRKMRQDVENRGGNSFTVLDQP